MKKLNVSNRVLIVKIKYLFKEFFTLSQIIIAITLLNIYPSVFAQPTCGEQANVEVPPPISLVLVAKGFAAPLHVTNSGDGSGRLFVANKTGSIQILKQGEILEKPFLDISQNLATINEQGLLSVAFHPQYLQNGRFFVFYTRQEPFSSVIAEFRVDPDNPDSALPEENVVLEMPQSEDSTMHRAGQLQFGPDGYLYASLGDALHPNQAQQLDTFNGKIIRLDVDSSDSENELAYSIPPTNPFVGQEGAKAEIWAYGFRNPWRFAIDSCTGDFFVGDVGSTFYEEVNLVEKGGNYGWPITEGSRCGDNRFGYKCGAHRFIAPIHEYGHPYLDPEGGSAVIGGYVYRGTHYPSLQGLYFFADVQGRVWTLTPSTATDIAGDYSYWKVNEVWEGYGGMVSFGQDEDNELLHS